MTYTRSLLFFIWFIVVSAVLHIVGLPLLFASRRTILGWSQGWARALLWGLEHIATLRMEIRGGPVPQRNVLVAIKHMSMWDTLATMVLFDDPAVVIKRQLLDIPFYGWYASRSGMIPIERSEGAKTIRAMRAAALAARDAGRPIVIFPEGTRRRLDDPPAYQPGVAALYGQLGVPCIPVAHNSALYWTAGGLIKKPGTIVIEFLEPIPAGLGRHEFLAVLEARIEQATQRLIAEGKEKSA